MKHPEYKEIGERIARVRRAHNITQEEMAEIMDISVKHVSCVENAISVFSLKQFVKFCKTFNCSLDYIIFGNSNDPAFSKIPKNIIDILNLGQSEKLDRLIRYLDMFSDLVE